MLIVIEGSSDGIGKSTQLKLLNEYLEKMKKDVIMFHFPSYNEISSFMINTYLDGKLGNEIFVLPDNSIYRHMEELENKYFLDALDVFTPPQNFCDPDDFVENYIDHFFT